MSWEEYRAYYNTDIEKFGGVKAWEHYHRMRWEYFQKLRPFKDTMAAYLAIPYENNPYRFDHN